MPTPFVQSRPQFVAVVGGQPPPVGTLRVMYTRNRTSRDTWLARANGADVGEFYPGDVSWHVGAVVGVTGDFGIADVGYGPELDPSDRRVPPGTVTTIAALVAMPREQTDGITFRDLNSYIAPTGLGDYTFRNGQTEWVASTRRGSSPEVNLNQSARVLVCRPVERPGDSLRAGQVIHEVDLLAMPEEAILGAVLIPIDSGYTLAFDWRCSLRCKVFSRPGGGVTLRYHGLSDPDAHLDDEEPGNNWPVEYTHTYATSGNTRVYLVYRVPTFNGSNVPVTRPLAGPYCPLCNRSERHVVSGGRHRTTPNGPVWCEGDRMATAVSNLLSTTKCPRCSEVCWASQVKDHTNTSGTIRGCLACRTLAARLHDHGAQPHELRFGLELETEGISYTAEAAEVVSKHGGDWSAKPDGSLRGPMDKKTRQYKNAEVISPPLLFNEENIARVQTMARKLRNAGSRHGERCGLHVHVGMEMLSVTHVKDVVNWWYSMQSTVLQALPPWYSRQDFCRGTDENQIRKVRSSEYADKKTLATTAHRYAALNLASLAKHGTVEFRFFNGSVHAGKVRAYVEFCTRLVSFASRNPHVRTGAMAGRSPAFGTDRNGMVAILDALEFEPGNTSQRWHLLGTFATEEDRPGPKPDAAPVTPLRPVLAPPPPPPPDEDDEDDYDGDRDDDF